MTPSRRTVIGLRCASRILAAALVVALLTGVVPTGAQGHPGPLHIDELHGSVTTTHGVRWVHVYANVCVRSSAEVGRLVPEEFRLTQFIVYKGRWTPIRNVIEYAPWIVAFADAWQGKPCGTVSFSDPFRWAEGFAGFDRRDNCFGVSFSLKAGGRTASKRVTIRCPNP
jgi:hypothetical protein